ncbi:coiled-coil domain-containing protein 191 [Danio rerio]|uniref:Coiled-coil domain-containing protein 191 n=1 Tax=Danio rerio TaxID=7955 RepID=Q5M7X8_DANRE|nr:coiled-coil domain-containing protein 191 [Danio rerio]AAH88387.1 Zgc:92218 [Danio rerio]|eukprot:NP_001009986.1 coiled-coil domain-containing protein 191 [Danio rerio]
MAHSTHRPDIFRWKTTKTKTSGNNKVQLNDNDIKQWVKRVERASEFAVSEVFSLKKPHNGKKIMPLQSVEQLQDHDDAYSEAQSILSEWMNQKLRLELEMDDDDEEEEEISSSTMEDSESKQLIKNTESSYNNFDDLYFQLEQEEENSVVHHFLQDLMETEVLDFGMVENLKEDSDQSKKRWRDPSLTMEVRHKQVKENRMRRDAEREKLRKEKEVLKEARQEVRQMEQEKQRRKRQEAQRQEELIQQEMIRLRREMEEKKNVEQLARNMERERLQQQKATKSSVIPKHHNPTQNKELQLKLKNLEAKIHLLNLQRMQKHFSAWYSMILERRVRMGKAAALCDWRRQLRAWRAWRALVWARREKREAEKTEEELRHEHRRCQQALESDRRRLLRRCFSDWRVWCQVECHRKELLQQQEETRCKMAALINSAASGKLRAVKSPSSTNHPETPCPTENISLQEGPATPDSGSSTAQVTNSSGRSEAQLTQAWQVTRRHAALSMAELRRARQTQQSSRSRGAELSGGQFKHRHAALQQTVAEQRRLLKEQQEQILLLQERQNILELRRAEEKMALIATGSPEVVSTCCQSKINKETTTGCAEKPRTKRDSRESADQKSSVHRAPLPHPTVQAMEERARLRAERRKEMEELRRHKQEKKLAQMKAAEEERLRAEEEEKQREVERKKEEKRQQKKRELEKQKRVEHEQEQSKRATQHYLTTLLLHRGLTPWRRLLEQSHANTQRAEDHYTHTLQRHCLCVWRRCVFEAQAEREASACLMHQRILLQRTLKSWRRLKDVRFILEARAEHFYKTNIQRKVLTALLDHMTEERILAWDDEQRAQQHNNRRAVRKCFSGWTRLPVVLREEREREERREQLRRKVAEILPDFRSSPMDSLWR